MLLVYFGDHAEQTLFSCTEMVPHHAIFFSAAANSGLNLHFSGIIDEIRLTQIDLENVLFLM